MTISAANISALRARVQGVVSDRYAEEQRITAHIRASLVGHPEWENACISCGCEIKLSQDTTCQKCELQRAFGNVSSIFRDAAHQLGYAMRTFHRQLLISLASEYRRERGRVPGSERTKRLRKKRSTALYRYLEPVQVESR